MIVDPLNKMVCTKEGCTDTLHGHQRLDGLKKKARRDWDDGPYTVCPCPDHKRDAHKLMEELITEAFDLGQLIEAERQQAGYAESRKDTSV